MKLTTTDVLYAARVIQAAPSSLRAELAEYIFLGAKFAQASSTHDDRSWKFHGDGSLQSACFGMSKTADLELDRDEDRDSLKIVLNAIERFGFSHAGNQDTV